MDRPWLKHVAPGTPASITIPEISLNELLERSIAAYPEHTAMTFKTKRYTYRELGGCIRSVAASLGKRGVRKGDRIGLMLPNCPQYPISFFGALACGAEIVQLNPMYKSGELLHVLNDSNVKVLVILDRLSPVIDAIRNETPVEQVITVSFESACVFDELLGDSGDSFQTVTIDPKEEVAVLQYTGGTTGMAKGAMLTHFNIVANTLQSAATSESRTVAGEERVLCISPLFHVYGMTSGMCLTFHHGGNLILAEKFDVEETVQLIKETQPTTFPGVPTMYIALLNRYSRQPFDLGSLNKCVSGSAPLPLEVLERFKTIGGVQIMEGYGLSEASPVTHRNPIEGLQKAGSIGIPIPNTDARIVDRATGMMDLPFGEVGELIIKGPQIMKGYCGLPEETEQTIRNGWLYTGDLAMMDEDGFFFIVGRKKEMIIASGFNVYPIEVENILYMHPAVLEAAVIGVADPYRGECIKAVIVLREGMLVSEEELILYCKEKMAAYKVPSSVVFVDEMPKTAVGKILKRKLQV